MLDIQNITVQYAGAKLPVIEDFSLRMSAGEIVSLVGESGSGKTTVIRAVHGTLPGGGAVTRGDILYQGSSLLANSEKQWRKLRGTKISMIFQDSGAMLDPIRTIGAQFVEYIREHQAVSRREAEALVGERLKAVRLPDPKHVMESYPFELSGGMRQRVGIALAMTFEPALLLADEPTSALDVTTQAQIVRQMMRLRSEAGAAILMITHNLALAAYMSDRILVMQRGRVVEQGTREQILGSPSDAYTKKLLQAVPILGGNYYV